VTRRFPPPWSVEEQAACFVVRDHNGQALASAAKLLTRDEARRIAANIVKLPGLLRKFASIPSELAGNSCQSSARYVIIGCDP
jgi:hypothetical protein